ncbi:MAG TPA: DUF4350 domain-containing protein [Candidatus Baltobacteraceae bacterium]|nr:DUF4350 domain-containing protein [Candidatus Baltobacteraceae bacterium]
MPRKAAFDVAILAAAVVLLTALAWLRGSQQAAQISVPSTYDTGPNGYAALYDLLAGEGVRAQRFERPIGELESSRGALVIAGDGALSAAAPSRSSLAELDTWVRRGGRLVLLDADLSQAAQRALLLPAPRNASSRKVATTGCAFVRALHASAVAGTFWAGYAPACTSDRATLLRSKTNAVALLFQRGKGSIALFSSASAFDNLHLSQRANARVALAVFGPGPVQFDERVYGYAAGTTFWNVLPLSMRIAIAIAAAAVLLGVVGANLPFAPPYDAQAPEERDSSAYIASLARMLERGGAAAEAIARIRAHCEQVLSHRAHGDELARVLLRELRTLESTPRPGAHELLAAGRVFERVRKDYGC